MAGRYLRYPEYRDSGQTWCGEIPSHWDFRRTKFLFQILKRIAGELGHSVLSITQKGIKIKDTESGEGQLSMDYSKYQLVKVGDFAMNHMDLLTGYIDISKYDGVTSPDYRVFCSRDSSIVDRYFLYLYQLAYIKGVFFPLGQGSAHLGRWRLPAEEFNDFRWPVPSKKEQKNIANFLDHEIAKIDTLINKQQQLLSLLKEKRDSLVHEALEHSEVKTFRFSNVVDSISRPITRLPSDYYTPIGLYNRGRGIFHKEATLGEDLGDSDFFWVKEGDLIFSGQFAWEGAISLASEEEEGCVVSHRYPVIKGKEGVAETSYLFAALATRHGDFLLNEHSRGAAGRNRPLNIRSLLKEKITLPPLSAQTRISQLIHSQRLIGRAVTRKINLLEEHRTALISAAVTGKIDVRNWQPAG